MIRRWLIRSLFIALAMTCVVVWVGGYWRVGEIGYIGSQPDCRAVYANGRAYLEYSYYQFPHKPFWVITALDTSLVFDWQAIDRHAAFAAFGFSFRHEEIKDSYDEWYLTIPLWFLTLLSGGLLWLVWRKTKVKPKGGAFPVEMAAAKTEGRQT